MYSPIAFFCFNRPFHTYQTLNALVKNKESSKSDLIVFIDGPEHPSQIELIANVEKIILSFAKSFQNLTINKSEINLGGARNQSYGITQVLKKHEKIIVIEDDVLVSPSFLKYMNKSLDLYYSNKKIWHINGFNFPINSDKEKECYFSKVMFCWGWGTWQSRWIKYKNDLLFQDPYYLKELFTKKMIKEFNLNTNINFFWSQIQSNLKGKISWDIFWYSYIFLNKGLCLTPYRSLTKNIGHDGSGVHCGKNSKIQKSLINMKHINKFPKNNLEDIEALKKMRKYLRETYNIRAKIFRKLKSFFPIIF